MANIAAFFTDLTGTLAGSGVCTLSYANLSDDEAMLTHQTIAALAREVEKCAALSAADLTRRSDPALGQAGLAWRKGHVNPEAMLQHISGGSRVSARRLVTVGTMMAEAETAAEAAAEAAKQAAEHPEDEGLAAVLAAAEVPWHAVLGDAVTAGRVGAETANSIRNGLGEVAEGVTPEILRDALVALIVECAHLNADQAHQVARRVRDQIDATGIAARAEAKRARQYLRMWVKPDGMVQGDFELDPENGMLFKDQRRNDLRAERFGQPPERRIGNRSNALGQGLRQNSRQEQPLQQGS